MKKILFITLLAFSMNAKAQINLQHDYDSASTYPYIIGSSTVSSQLMIVNFAVSGERYVKINRWNKSIEIYDMSYNLLKTIDCSHLPMYSGNPVMGNVIYLSENLFSTDSKIAFMYGYYVGPTVSYTGIYEEDGTLLFSDTCAPLIDNNVPLQQYPIYNTTEGTKMILSYNNGHAKVFSLPGTLTSCCNTENIISLALQRQGSLSNPYPNPNNNSTKIDYTLPPGINEGEIVFYNLLGDEVKRFKVDRTFNTLLISTSDLAAGTYLYQLQTSAQSTEGKKMVVIK